MNGRRLELKNWGMAVGRGEKLFCLLGLNVLEDEKLALETAQELKRITSRLGLPLVFKGSFDKANRSSLHSYRGPGIEAGLKMLQQVRERVSLPVITDIHEVAQAEAVARAVDIVQIPAFLIRQTDLIVAAAKAVEASGGLLHLKKAQFQAPWDTRNILEKVNKAAPSRPIAMLCERGVSFGYNNLVVDMLGIPEMQKLGVPVTMDATHAVQLPGAGKGAGGENTATGGRREGVEILARSAIAAGADGIFLEFHPDPEKAKCDGPSALPLAQAERVLKTLAAIHSALPS